MRCIASICMTRVSRCGTGMPSFSARWTCSLIATGRAGRNEKMTSSLLPVAARNTYWSAEEIMYFHWLSLS
jgi:hypothetical protein